MDIAILNREMVNYMEAIVAKILVVTPTTGRPLLKRALNAVLMQDWEGEIEHYTVSDGCGEVNIPDSKEGRTFRFIDRKERGGPGASRNTALMEGLTHSPDFVAFIDDDDWWTNDALSTLVSELGDFDMVYGDISIYQYKITQSGEPVLEGQSVLFSRDWEYGVMKTTPYIPLPGCLFKADFFFKHGLFREDIGKMVDYELLARGEAGGARYKHIKNIVGFAEWKFGAGTDNVSGRKPEDCFPPCTLGRILTLIEGHYI